VVDVYASCFVKRDRPAAPTDAPPPGLTLSALQRDGEEGR
jgi:hypothetical protein